MYQLYRPAIICANSARVVYAPSIKQLVYAINSARMVYAQSIDPFSICTKY